MNPELLKPKFNQWGRAGMPHHFVERMYADYLRLRSVEKTAKLYNRTRQSVWEVFRSHRLKCYAKPASKVSIVWHGRKFGPGKNGYLRASEGKRELLHHLVWEAAHGPRPAGHQVMFKDGNKENWALENLECLPIAEVSRLTATGDNQFTVPRRERRIQENMGWIVRTAQRYVSDGVSMEDLIQEGRIAITIADRKFDHRRGVKFLSYASWDIRQRMQRFSQNHGCVVRSKDMKRSTHQVSLDQPVGADGDCSLGDLIAFSNEETTGDLNEADRSAVLQQAIATLKPIYRSAVERHFIEGKKLRQIAQEDGVTHQAVHLRVRRGLQQLRKALYGKRREMKEAA